MAEELETSQQIEMDNDKNLKYLEFVQVAVIYALLCFSSLYEFAKENSGPLQTGVQAVERTVKTVVGPVYQKFQDVPFELLKFVDRKVEDSLNEMERHVPPLVRQASSQARAVASEVQRDGVVDAAKSITKTVYTRYEPVAEQYALMAWRLLNRFSFFPQVVQIVVPTVVYWSKKYNTIVYLVRERGFCMASYLPLIPIDKIAKVLDENLGGPPMSTNGQAH